MITRVSSLNLLSDYKATKAQPSFGFAKLNETGRATADEFGYSNNEFVNGSLFKKQGFFSQSALTKELNDGGDFADICSNYGCTKNGKSNAEFIRTQILSGKSSSSLQNLSSDVRTSGLISLFKSNYDNPELTRKETDALLEMIKDDIESSDYVKYAGIIKVGTDK